MLTESRVPGSPSIRGRLSFAEPTRTANATDVQHHGRRSLDQDDPENHRHAVGAVDTGRIERGLTTRLVLWLVLHVCCTRSLRARMPSWNGVLKSAEALAIAGLHGTGAATKITTDHYTSRSVLTAGTK